MCRVSAKKCFFKRERKIWLSSFVDMYNIFGQKSITELLLQSVCYATNCECDQMLVQHIIVISPSLLANHPQRLQDPESVVGGQVERSLLALAPPVAGHRIA
jgi:hypothetical protein